MQAKDRLFRLMQSLTPGEKAYFKKYAAAHTRTDTAGYVQLFDWIDRQLKRGVRDVGIDESTIHRKLSSKTKFTNLPATKDYLFHQLLGSLGTAASVALDPSNRLRNFIDNSDRLFQKNMLVEAAKFLNRAKKTAYRLEDFSALLEICRKERLLAGSSYYPRKGEHYRTLANEEKEILEKLRNLREYQDLSELIIFPVLSLERVSRSEEDSKKIKEFLNNPLLQNPKLAKSFWAKEIYYSTREWCFDFINELQLAYESTSQLVKQWREQKVIRSAHQGAWQLALHSLFNNCYALGYLDQIPGIISEFKQIKPNSQERKVALFITIHQLEILYQLTILEFEKVEELAVAYIAWVRKYADQVNVQDPNYHLPTFFNVVLAKVVMEKYNDALEWMNLVLVRPGHSHQTLNRIALIVHLIIHYELGNFESLSYFAKSVYRKLLKQDKLFGVEKLVLEIIRKSQSVTGPRQMKQLFKTYYPQVIDLMNDPYESRAFIYFDFKLWIESKIGKKSLRELCVEELEKHLEERLGG